MILIVGGHGNGKRTFVMNQLGYASGALAEGVLDHRPVLCALESMDPLPAPAVLLEKEVVVCDEIGCGVIPANKSARAHREAVGRLCCSLARQAQQVYRVQCGLAMRLK